MNHEKVAAAGAVAIVNTLEAVSQNARLTAIISAMLIAITVGVEDGRETGGLTMSEKVEEIKKGLMACSLPSNSTISKCVICPYKNVPNCSENMNKDALAYIQLCEHSFDDLSLRTSQLEDHIRNLAKMVPKWISVEDRLPKNEEPVLIATKWSLMGMCGMAVSCGFYTNGKTFTGDSDYDWNSGNVDLGYDEEEDEYIVPEGWWESVRYTEQFSAVDEPVTHWMPLPPVPKEG